MILSEGSTEHVPTLVPVRDVHVNNGTAESLTAGCKGVAVVS